MVDGTSLSRILTAALILGWAGVAAAEPDGPKEAAAKAAEALIAALPDASLAVLVAPLQHPEGDASARAFASALGAALAEQGLRVVDRQALEAAVEEAALSGDAIDSAAMEMAGAFGAELVVTGSVSGLGGSYTANVRVVQVGSGNVVGTATTLFAAEGRSVSTEAITLDAQLRRLSDRLATGLDKLEGSLRYQRIAALPFQEVGKSTQDKQLGLLVAAQLTTLLRRDHGIMMVERTQLDKVIAELSLGQTGLTDPDKTTEVGKLAGAQGLIIGSVSEAGDRYLVDARVVAADTAQVVFAEAVPLPAADLVALSSEAVVLRTRSGAIYRSLLLPGWGQVYNREPIKGGIFVAAEVLAAGAAVGMHLQGGSLHDKYRNLPAGSSAQDFRQAQDRAESAYAWRNIAIYALAGIHLLNVLDAVLSGRTYETASVGGDGGTF